MSRTHEAIRDSLARCIVHLHRFDDSRAGREREARQWVHTLSGDAPESRWLAFHVDAVVSSLLDAVDAFEDWGTAVSDGPEPSPATRSAVDSLMAYHDLG